VDGTMHKGARGLAVSPPSRFVHPARLCSPSRVGRCPEPRSRELTASEQFLAQARAPERVLKEIP